MEQRVHRKKMIRDFKLLKQSALKESINKQTKTSKLRSQSVLEQMSKNEGNSGASSPVVADLKLRLRSIAQANSRRPSGMVPRKTDSRLGDFDY